jgi:predicted NUDIX family NTP pyrophosphohydrolase
MVLLVHPGGPYWRNKDIGAWQLPKGLIAPGEDALAAAAREVKEELGVALTGKCVALGSIRQGGGKRVDAFAVEQDFDCEAISSNLFELEWPPESGRIKSFPEIDAARWMTIDDAQTTMLKSQLPLLDRLKKMLA